MPGPLTRLTLLPYAQSFDGTSLRVRLLAIPGGSPLDPLGGPGSLSFATADLTLSVVLTSGLAGMPPAGTQILTRVPSPAPAQAATLFAEMAAMFTIDPTPAPAQPRRAMAVRKHLPPSYRDASGLTQPRTPHASIDDSYACAYARLGTARPLPNRAAPIPWGRVIAIALRQPLLAEALGLIRPLTVTVPAGALEHGGWLHVTLDTAGDAGLLAIPDALAVFATRLGPLTRAQELFTPVLFPVPPNPAANYDEPFVEAIDYGDGFAKIVHAGQQRTADPHADTDDGTRPARETGIRIGWDDEQVTVWLNRQVTVLGANDPDTTMGVAGYRLDVRAQGEVGWHALCAATGPVTVAATDLGVWTGEVPVETAPTQLDAQATGEFWLGAYFTRWTGGSLVGGDPVGRQLSGGPPPPAGRITGSDPGVALTYGGTYEIRVRLADHTGGGPDSAGDPAVPGVAPIATVPFRRWVRPGRPEVEPPAGPDATSIVVRRPRLGYPAYPCTGVPHAVADLLADVPAAAAAGREPSLPDPDVTALRVDVLVQTPAFDPAGENGYVRLYTATRPLPSAPGDPLTLDLDWQDVHDASTLTDPGAGALPVPTSRDVRLEISALGRDDPHLAYFGADDVLLGPPTGIALRAAATDERALLVSGSPADFVRAFYLQPDPLDDPSTVPVPELADQSGAPGDPVSRLAAALDLDAAALTLRARPGRRVVFGAAAGLRHTLGPDAGSLAVASRGELTRQWVVALRARLARDWTWTGLSAAGITVLRDGVEVGRVQPVPVLADEAETEPIDRAGTDLVFLDVVDTRPAVGAFPKPVTVSYQLRADWVAPPISFDDPLAAQDVTLPVTSRPAQVPRLLAAGIALSPYEHSDDYSSTTRRRRTLWLQLDRPPDDPDDAYFARALRSAPDPLLTGGLEARVTELPVEQALPVDAEFVRMIVPGQSDDRAGITAMQELIPGDQPGYYLLPLPPGVHADDPVMIGFWTYEFRVGHAAGWSTAQGRFGNPLRVAGIQHPAPPLPCSVGRHSTELLTGVRYALPVDEGLSLQPFPPSTQIWVMLYAQVERADRGGYRNVLVGQQLARPNRELWDRNQGPLTGDATWAQTDIAVLLAAIGLGPDAPLSVLAAEVISNQQPAAEPLGRDLGSERILRVSPLIPVPTVCCDCVS